MTGRVHATRIRVHVLRVHGIPIRNLDTRESTTPRNVRTRSGDSSKRCRRRSCRPVAARNPSVLPTAGAEYRTPIRATQCEFVAQHQTTNKRKKVANMATTSNDPKGGSIVDQLHKEADTYIAAGDIESANASLDTAEAIIKFAGR